MKTQEKYNEVAEFQHANVEYETEVVTTYKAVTIKNKLPKLPIALWNQIVTFLCYISEKHNTEAILSLTTVNGAWVPIIWHQETEGALHVKFDVTSKDNQKLLTPELKEALKEVHCTIHSHNKANAFQSGDDKDDELAKKGWHITIGNCDKASAITTHCRFNCQTHAVFNDKGIKEQDAWQEFVVCKALNVIKTPPLPILIPKECRDTVNNLIVQRNHKVDYPEEWNARVKKKTYQAKIRQHYGQRTHTTHTTYPKVTYGKAHTGTTTKAKKYIPIEDSIYIDDDQFDSTRAFFSPTWSLVQLFYQSYNSKSMMQEMQNHIEASIDGSSDTLDFNVLATYDELFEYCEEERQQDLKYVIQSVQPFEVFMQTLIATWTAEAASLNKKEVKSVEFLKTLCRKLYIKTKKK